MGQKMGLWTVQEVQLVQFRGLFGYHLLLKTKNWKHCNKIIFKCVIIVVRPSFKVFFFFFGLKKYLRVL